MTGIEGARSFFESADAHTQKEYEEIRDAFANTLEQKKMIVNSMITRIDVFSGYELKVEFAFDIRQFFEGLDFEISV